MLERFLWCTEELVLRYLARESSQAGKPDTDAPYLPGLLHHLFRRSELAAIGGLSLFARSAVPRNLLCGRVIGSVWLLEKARMRLEQLRELAHSSSDLSLGPFKAIEQVTHDFPLVDFRRHSLHPRNLESQRTLLPAEDSKVHVLRYRLAGFPDEFVTSKDLGTVVDGSAEETLRGKPRIEDLGCPSVWDKEFYALGGDIAREDSVPKRYRAETITGLAVPGLFEVDQLHIGAPHRVGYRHPVLWQSQLLNMTQQTWNQTRTQSGKAVANRLAEHLDQPRYPTSLLKARVRAGELPKFGDTQSEDSVQQLVVGQSWVALEADTGKVLRRVGKEILADQELADGRWRIVSAPLSDFEKWDRFFRIISLGHEEIALLSPQHGYLYLNDDRKLEAGASTVLPTSRFRYVPLVGGRVALKADNGKYLSPDGRNKIEASKDDIDRECEFTVLFADRPAAPYAFWSDGSCLDAQHQVSFRHAFPRKVWGRFERGHETRLWSAHLFDHGGPPARIRIGVRVSWEIDLYGVDVWFRLGIDLVRTAYPMNLWGLERLGKAAVESQSLLDRNGTHLPKKRDWGRWSRSGQDECASLVLDVSANDRVWLKTQATVGWPGPKFHDPGVLMYATLRFQIEDIVLGWDHQRSIQVAGLDGETLKRNAVDIPAAI
jgi:hypothetical protein